MDGPETGPCLVEDRARRAHYMFNHLEYDADTLKLEYLRDLASDQPTRLPENYFPDEDPSQPPVYFWRASAATLFNNWLNETERERTRAEGDELLFQWLASGREATRAESAGDRTEFLVVAEGDARSVSRVARTVSARRCWSRDLAWRPVGEETLLIELRVDALDQSTVKETVRALLALARIRAVAVRDPQGFGGLFRAGPGARGPGADRPPNRARLKGMLSVAA